jgi:xanthine/CO dehydrogenase XdhC/CoxF family maturation factor
MIAADSDAGQVVQRGGEGRLSTAGACRHGVKDLRSQWRVLRNLGERGQDAVLVTLASGKGSTPRDAGAKMVVTPDALHGTIGGGEVEYQATDIARQMLRDTDTRRAKRYPLGADFGQHCGGVANLIFERSPAGAEWVRTLSAWFDCGYRSILVTLAADNDGDRRLLVAPSHRRNRGWHSRMHGRLNRHAACWPIRSRSLL